MDETEFDPDPLDRIHGIGGADLVQKMTAIFFKNGPERTATAIEGGASDDLETVERAVHSLRSSAGNMGARGLQNLCEEIEDLAAAGTREGLGERLDRLESTYREAEARVRARLEELRT